jgi:HD-like signal output (HDOD) protein
MKQYVGTLKLAIVILGVREVRNIVLGIAVVDTLHDEKLVTLVAKNFWSHAFTVAGFAKKLANTLQIGTQGEAFTSGLLHDIGKLILLRQLGSSYADIIKKSGGSSDLLCIAEREKYGFSHADAAAALAVAWNFPAALGDALLLHHAVDGDLLSNAKDPKLAAIIRISNLAAHEDFEAPQGDSHPSLNEEAWQILKSVPAPIAWESRYDVLKSIAEELKEVPIPNF